MHTHKYAKTHTNTNQVSTYCFFSGVPLPSGYADLNTRTHTHTHTHTNQHQHAHSTGASDIIATELIE